MPVCLPGYSLSRARAIMHFVGSIIEPESVENPLKYYHNNTTKSRALMGTAIEAGVPHFIFSSTAATYGIPESSPVTEDSPKLQVNPYGMSKLMTEQMLAAAHVLALETLIAKPGRSLTMNCGYGRGFSVLEVLDAVDRVANLTLERRLEGRRSRFADFRQRVDQA